MSVTLADIRGRVLVLVNAADSRMPGHHADLVKVDQVMRNAYIGIQFQLPGATVHTTNAFTIAANSETFTLPNSNGEEYRGQVHIQINVPNYRFLRRVSLDEMQSLRAFKPPEFNALITDFALFEDNAQVVQGFVYPRANQAYPCNLTRTLTAADFTTSALDSSTIAMSREAMDALVYETAADLVAGMSPDELQLRKLNPQVAGLWRMKASKLVYKESDRLSNLKTVGRVQRWVS